MRIIPYGRQSISQEDIDAVIDVLRSDFLTQGPNVEEFERSVAAYCGVKYAVAVNSATSALHIACLSLGVSTGDIVWTSPNTFVASANCALYCGAMIDFVDIDPITYNFSPEAFEEKLENAKKTGDLPKAIIPVHFSGQSCNMSKISEIARRYNVAIIEDASHAIGGSYGSKKIGSCEYSSLCVFSFHPVKIITSGEGGMVTTNDERIYQSLLRLRSHGITRDPAYLTKESEGPWYYEQIELGYNYRITDIQAALGASQLKRIDTFIDKRHTLADRYDDLLSKLPFVLPTRESEGRSALHLYPVQIQIDKTKLSQKGIFENLREKGIFVQLHYIPVHLQPYYRTMGFNPGDFPVAESYYSKAMSLPMYYDLGFDTQDLVVNELMNCIERV